MGWGYGICFIVAAYWEFSGQQVKVKHTENGAKDKREILKKIFFLFFHNNVHYAYSLEVP